MPTCARCSSFASDNAKDISSRYGLISGQSIAAIQRSLLKLESDGADSFFGEPALELADLMRQDMSGRGIINVLAADQLIMKPRLYSTFLLWLLSELFEQLPEVGDLDQPKMVFFFDEAHLLFDDASPALLQRVEQVVRLIRSKGVGVYFCSQNPDDVPGVILGQLGNRVQHALRAFTPRDQKAVKAAAETFVANPGLDVAEAITRTGRRRGAGVDPGQRRRAHAGATGAGDHAVLPHRRHHRRRAQQHPAALAGRRQVRHADQSRIRRRNARQSRAGQGCRSDHDRAARSPPPARKRRARTGAAPCTMRCSAPSGARA